MGWTIIVFGGPDTWQCEAHQYHNDDSRPQKLLHLPAPSTRLSPALSQKTLLTATFIYQLTYWGWVKLEKDELKADKLREIKGLEAELEKVSGGAIKGEDVKVKGI
ncbi:hypothetical protein DID88_010068 [Monilinia fructigena]|uniref:Uncharacterized protein n=1 Tax=Monilinia fructigena TaxID=38457 RepID=A0A395IKS8_9HELO|nr:hypothetical protein DID88_010068 [Monilinia fructigena]